MKGLCVHVLSVHSSVLFLNSINIQVMKLTLISVQQYSIYEEKTVNFFTLNTSKIHKNCQEMTVLASVANNPHIRSMDMEGKSKVEEES